MNALDVERAAMKKLTGIGALVRGQRVFTGQSLGDLELGAMFSLPDAGNSLALQDPTTGALYAMYSVDPYGSTYAP
jgi:hypothetical protein